MRNKDALCRAHLVGPHSFFSLPQEIGRLFPPPPPPTPPAAPTSEGRPNKSNSGGFTFGLALGLSHWDEEGEVYAEGDGCIDKAGTSDFCVAQVMSKLHISCISTANATTVARVRSRRRGRANPARMEREGERGRDGETGEERKGRRRLAVGIGR
jgi:hypothetical protein